MQLIDFETRGAAVRSLCEAFATAAPPHASLIAGAYGTGKRTLAALCAQSLFCQNGRQVCGQCPACKRFLAGSHPDVHRITARKSIGVDEIRELIEVLQEAAYEGGWKVALIEEAGSMTPQAQNSLLKTLEEPPNKTVFLLTAQSASSLLPTIRSRCRMVFMPQMTQEQVEAELKKRGVEGYRAAQLAALSEGSLGEALDLQGDEAFWALRGKLREAMGRLRTPADVPETVNALKDDKADAQKLLNLLEGALRDALSLSIRKQEGEAENDAWGRRLENADPTSLIRLLENTKDMRRMLASNVPWQAALERFILKYAEESKAWRL